MTPDIPSRPASPESIKARRVGGATFDAKEISRRMIELYEAVREFLPETERCGEPFPHRGIQMIEDLHREAKVWRVWGYLNADDPDDQPHYQAFVRRDGIEGALKASTIGGREYARFRVDLVTDPIPYPAWDEAADRDGRVLDTDPEDSA